MEGDGLTLEDFRSVSAQCGQLVGLRNANPGGSRQDTATLSLRMRFLLTCLLVKGWLMTRLSNPAEVQCRRRVTGPISIGSLSEGLAASC